MVQLARSKFFSANNLFGPGGNSGGQLYKKKFASEKRTITVSAALLSLKALIPVVLN